MPVRKLAGGPLRPKQFQEKWEPVFRPELRKYKMGGGAMADKKKSKGMLERVKGLLGRDAPKPPRQAPKASQPAATPASVPATADARPVFDSGYHPLADGCPPDWASGWGEDRFGVFVEFTFGEVTQRLRWIGPGRFMMGSPDDEPGRYGEADGPWNEGPQHEVRISKGFWLFDTPVTQALWTAVMGDNPSHFKDNPEHPVEQVSWDDATQFMQRLNGIIPDLDLVLPTEAQWEYACRAGTAAPFWWGASITPAQANYDGNYPYEGGSKGEYREKTVPVKSFQPNPWGLYQVHGNVWEWCSDGRRTYSAEAVNDPVGPLVGAERALRGGSWVSDARDVRAANRDADDREDRSNSIGFRCARVRS